VIAAPKTPAGAGSAGRASATARGSAKTATPSAAVMARLNQYLSHP
jgi:hypothetical protein